MNMLPILEYSKKKKFSFYCMEKGLFCKVAKCATKKTECQTEREIFLSNQAGELASCM